MKSIDEPAERFRSGLEDRSLLRGVKRLLVAVSGGADSTALAVLLHDYCRTRAGPVPELFVGHVHHGIRDVEADGDEAFVAALAEELAVQYLREHVNVPEFARQKRLSLELAARRARYDVFRLWARSHRLDAIATAHQRDDQRETLLLRLARGTGLQGLRGIPVRRHLRGCGRTVRLIRPLLDWSRREVLAFLAGRGRVYREDSTNEALECARNRVRHRVLPLLEREVHPGVRGALDRLIVQAEELGRDLDLLAERALAAATVDETSSTRCVLDPAILRSWPPSVLRGVFRFAVERLDPAQPALSSRTFARLLDLLREQDVARRVVLREVVVEARYGRLRLERVRSMDREAEPEPIDLVVGEAPVPWKHWRLGVDTRPYEGGTANPLEEWVEAASVEAGMCVRGRRGGDLFHPLGAPGRQNLKEFLRSRRIPPSQRDDVPLVDSGGTIVWVVGQRLADPFRVRTRSRGTLRLYAFEEITDPRASRSGAPEDSARDSAF